MNSKLVWICQLVAAFIIGGAGVLKLMGNPVDIFVFSQLGMEPFGRYLIAILEALASLLLFSGTFAAPGALLAIGTMMGAAIAHITVLGFDVQGDGGMHIAFLTTVVLSAGSVLLARRRELPLVGSTL